jgi:hypothetical protein
MHPTLADYTRVRAHLRRLVEASQSVNAVVSLDKNANPAVMDEFVESIDGGADILKDTPEPPPGPVPASS